MHEFVIQISLIDKRTVRLFLRVLLKAVVHGQKVDPEGEREDPSQHDVDVPQQLLTLLVELLRSHELPALAMGGAWHKVAQCVTGRPALGRLALELGLFDLGASKCTVPAHAGQNNCQYFIFIHFRY